MNLHDELLKCIQKMEEIIPKSELKQIKDCAYDQLYLYHLGLGTWIRNNVLTPKAEITTLFRESGIKELDEMSSFIIKCLYMKLNLDSSNR